MSELPVKPISDIEEKQTVSENDKILILDSVSEEARLASKEELRGEQGETWPQGEKGNTWDKGDKGDKGDKWDKGDKGDTWSQGIQGIQGEKGDKGDKGDTWNGIVDITTTTSWKVHTVTITDSEGNVDTFQVMDWYDGTGAWDMVAATYDPNGLQADAFDYDNFINVPTVNTRQFILPSLSSLTVAQQIYEYALWGDGAVIRYNNEDYFLSWFDNGDPIFLRTKIESATSNDWTNTYMKDTGLKFTIVSANVTAISVVNNTNPWYLATGVNYATPYTPEYNGSPATKKYVDDGLSDKQDTISDLATIRSWASAGATAVQPWDLGTAATKNTWTSAWNVPVLDANGKLETSIVPNTTLASLNDTTITTPTDKQILQFNGTNQKWENTTAILGDNTFITAEGYESITPEEWMTYFIYEKWSQLKEFSELQTMTASDVVTELNTKANDYYNKFSGEQRLLVDNGNYYFCDVIESLEDDPEINKHKRETNTEIYFNNDTWTQITSE